MGFTETKSQTPTPISFLFPLVSLLLFFISQSTFKTGTMEMSKGPFIFYERERERGGGGAGGIWGGGGAC